MWGLFAVLLPLLVGGSPANLNQAKCQQGWQVGAPGFMSTGFLVANPGSGGATIVDFPAQYVPGKKYTITVNHPVGNSMATLRSAIKVNEGAFSGTGVNIVADTSDQCAYAVDVTSQTYEWTAPADNQAPAATITLLHASGFSSAMYSLSETATNAWTDTLCSSIGNAEGTNLASTGCTCKDGYKGTISSIDTAPFYFGLCEKADCAPAPELAEDGSGNCICGTGFTGSPTWNRLNGYWDWDTCVPVPAWCPAVGPVANGQTGCEAGVIASRCTPECTSGWMPSPGFVGCLESKTWQSYTCVDVSGVTCPSTGYTTAATGYCTCADGWGGLVDFSGATATGCTQCDGVTWAQAGYNTECVNIQCVEPAYTGFPGSCECADGYQGSVSYVSGAATGCTVIPDYCPSVAAPTDGSTGCASAIVNELCFSTCNVGFVGPNMTCSADQSDSSVGAWDPPPQCLKGPPVCPASAADPVAGTTGCEDGWVGDSCTNTCAMGYTANTGITCTESGWSATATCTPIANYCPALLFEDTTQACAASTVATECTSSCGVSSQGSTQTCIADTVSAGVWSDLPFCEAIICPTLDPGGNVTVGCEETQVDGTCTPSCLSGFQPNTITCGSDRLWSANLTCDFLPEYCASVTNPDANGAGDCAATFFNELCTTSCNNGYVGNDVRCVYDTDSAGKWDGPQTCFLENTPVCPQINGTEGNRGCDPSFIDEECLLECNLGYEKAVGSTVCITDGGIGALWSGPTACTAIAGYCPSLPAAGNGTAGCATATVTTKCSGTCADGYEPFIENVCLPDTAVAGKWAYDLKCIVPTPIRCLDLAVPQNGKDICLDAAPGATCSPTCMSGYTPSVASLTCSAEGSWSPLTCPDGPDGDCFYTCDPIPAWCPVLAAEGTNGATGCAAGEITDVCTTTCNQGWTGNSVTCQTDQMWSGAAVCTKDDVLTCPDLPAPSPGGIAGCIGYDSVNDAKIETCTPICKAGYTANTGIICDAENAWSADPTCTIVPDYCKAVDPAASNGVGGCADSSIGTDCSPTCADGYVPFNTLTCQDDNGVGAWSATPECIEYVVPECNSQDAAVPGGTFGCAVAGIGATCANTCDLGYTANVVTCEAVAGTNSAAWDADVTCTVIADYCAAIATPAFATNGCADSAVGAGCTINCDTGYQGSSITCDSDSASVGQWSTAAACAPIPEWCPAQNAPAGHTAGCAASTVATTCAPVCQTGYTANAPVCGSSGAWDVAPACTPTAGHCAAVAPDGTTISAGCDAGAIGDKCTLTCAGGKAYSGEGTCRSDGTWFPAQVCTDSLADLCYAAGDPEVCPDGAYGQACNDCLGKEGYVSKEPVTCMSEDSSLQVGGYWSIPSLCPDPLACSTPVVPGNANCVPVTCTPSAVAYSNYATAGSITGKYGDQAIVVTCSAGYSGGGSVSCQSTGVFTTTECVLNVCTCPNGVPATASGQYGALCENNGDEDCASCDLGWQISVPADTGTLSTCPSKIADYCLATGAVAGTTSTCPAGEIGATCADATCESGYTAGTGVTCVADTAARGKWSPALCAPPSCGALTVANSDQDGTAVTEGILGATQQVACIDGYTATSQSLVAQCKLVQGAAIWANTVNDGPVSCAAAQCPPLTVANSDADNVFAYTGDTVTVKCNAGHYGTGLSNECRANVGASTSSWTTTPVCTVQACPSDTTGSDVVSGCTCKSGYDGTFVATTSDPYYSGSCTAQVCSTLPPSTAQGSKGNCVAMKSDEVCTEQCADGYTSAGDGYYTCPAGTLSSGSLTCTANGCDGAVGAGFDTAVCTTIASGTTCTQSCLPGYAPSGSAGYTCTAGSLSGGSLVCTPRGCPADSTGTNLPGGCACDTGFVGTIAKSTTGPDYYTGSCTAVACPQFAEGTSGGAGTCTCLAGYSATPGPDITWSGSAWEGTCVAQACTLPSNTGYDTSVCPSFATGGTCTAACLPGYTLQGSADFTCPTGPNSETGTMVCAANACTLPSGTGWAAFTDCTFTTGTTCVAKCGAGYENNPTGGDGAFTCLANGGVSGSFQCDASVCTPPTGTGYETAYCGTFDTQTPCDVLCQGGYTSAGTDNTFTCASGNSVTQLDATFECVPDNCAAPTGTGLDASGCSSLKTGGSCTVACQAGYDVDPSVVSPVYTCPDGVTLGDFKCVARTCAEPTGVGFVENSCPGFATGDDCTTSCKVGYVRSGNYVFTCPYGDVVGAAMVCTPQTCAPPTGTAFDTSDCDGKKTGSSCDVACTGGYTETGNVTYSCTDGTAFTGGSAVCEPNGCALPTGNAFVANADCDNFVTGSECTMRCAEGFGASGDATYTCVAGVTSGGSLTCTAGSCSAPTGLGFDTSACAGITTGNGCLVTCHTGYTASGTNYYQCLDGSTLEGGSLVCTPDACSEPVGQGYDASACSGLTTGGTCQVSCATGYVGSSSTFSCPAGTATGSLVCTPQGCSVPEGAGFDASACASVESGGSCTVACKTGWTQTSGTGSGDYTCPAGVLTGGSLTCTANVCNFATLPGRDVSGCSALVADGPACDIACIEGYAASGNPTYTCANGVLGGGSLVCVAKTCNMPVGAGFDTSACTNTVTGESCTVQCKAGWSTSGSGDYSCQPTGTLTGGSLVCTADACTANLPSGAGYDVSGCAGLKTDGAACTIACNPGYGNSGNPSYTCAGGTLGGGSLICTAGACTVPPGVSGLGYDTTACAGTTTGGGCTISCKAGYTSSGDGAYTCTAGVLGGGSLVCTADVCAAPSGANFDTVSCPDFKTDTTCTVACKTGYTSSGSGAYTCPLGVTTGNLVCTPKVCSTLPSGSGVDITACAGLKTDGTCTAACKTGWTASGVAAYTCAGGVLGGGSLTCSANACSTKPSGNGVDTTGCANLVTDGSCTATCQATFTASGSGSYTCAGGTLGGGSLVCTSAGGECSVPSGDNFVTTACGSTMASGSSCTVTCADGFSGSGTSAQYTCTTGSLSGGDWACAADACTPSKVANSDYASDGSITGVTGDDVVVTCLDGFTGGGTVTCFPNGLFSDTVSCTANTCAVLDVANSDTSSVTTPSPLGTQQVVTCADGYTGSGTATCSGTSSPVWTPTITCALASCGDLTVPDSDQNAGSTTGVVGDSVTVTCSAGFTSGPSANTFTATCAGGTGATANWVLPKSCEAVACPLNSVGDYVVDGCLCEPGFAGWVHPAATVTGFDSTCALVPEGSKSSVLTIVLQFASLTQAEWLPSHEDLLVSTLAQHVGVAEGKVAVKSTADNNGALGVLVQITFPSLAAAQDAETLLDGLTIDWPAMLQTAGVSVVTTDASTPTLSAASALSAQTPLVLALAVLALTQLLC